MHSTASAGSVRVARDVVADVTADPWRGFEPGRWHSEIDVRGFIVSNTQSYARRRDVPRADAERRRRRSGRRCSPISARR